MIDKIVTEEQCLIFTLRDRRKIIKIEHWKHVLTEEGATLAKHAKVGNQLIAYGFIPKTYQSQEKKNEAQSATARK